MGPRTRLWVSACKTACLASELLVSMGPSPHLWFLHAKQRLLDPNNKSLCVPDLICGFCMQNSVISTWSTSLYVSQPSSVVFACKNSAFWNKISSLYGSQNSSVVLSTHNCVLNTGIKRLFWFQPSPVVLCKQNSDFRTRITSLCVSNTSPVVFAS